MTVGVAASRANSMLSVLNNTADSAIASVTLKLHIGDPGAAGTGNPSGHTSASTAVVWSAASGGSISRSSGGVFATISGVSTTDTISHISLWNSSTFLWSVPLSANKVISNGDSLTVSTLTISFTPIAA